MLKLFKKDLILFFNDRRSYSLSFLIPIILITLFAFAYGGVEKYTGKSEDYKLLVSDLDMSELSRIYISRLDSTVGLQCHLTDTAEAIKLINVGKYSSCLIIDKGFMNSLFEGRPPTIQLVFDREQNFEVGMLQSILINSIISFLDDLSVPESADPDPKNTLTQKHSALNTPLLELKSIVGEKNDLNLGLIQAVAGTAILMLLFSVASIGTSILEEKENGTINRLLFSPVSLDAILLSKMLFAFFISMVQLTVMFSYSWLFLDLDISINPPALVLMIVATSFSVSGLGIFLAAIAKSRAQAQNLSTIIILVMSAIGGSMIPLFIMPDIMDKIAILSVNYWSIQGFYDIFWRSLPLVDIIPKIVILITSGLIFSLASLRLFSKNILKII